MGCYPIGAECCNNCVHWSCARKRRYQGAPPKEVYTDSNEGKCTSSRSPRSGRQALSKDTCIFFVHIDGITKTFAAPEKHAAGDHVSNMLDCLDEGSRAFMQATMDYMEARSAINRERSARNQAVKANNRRVYIEHGMDPDASEDDQESFAILYGEACKGEADGYLGLAEGYYLGQFGALVDKEKAVKYYRIAIEKGLKGENLGAAECRLALCYLSGEGAAEDKERGMNWLDRAARHGNESAQELLAEMKKSKEEEDAHRREEESRRERELREELCKDGMDPNATREQMTRFKELVQRAYNGDGDAKYEMGMGYYEGRPGFCKSYSRAYGSFMGAALLKQHVRAMFKVGYMLYFGEGVDENEPEAFNWFEQAAKKDNPDGMCRLGECYCNGRGCTKNDEEGFKWYLKSAEKGVGLAQVNVGRLFYKGIGTSVDYDKAFHYHPMFDFC